MIETLGVTILGFVVFCLFLLLVGSTIGAEMVYLWMRKTHREDIERMVGQWNANLARENRERGSRQVSHVLHSDTTKVTKLAEPEDKLELTYEDIDKINTLRADNPNIDWVAIIRDRDQDREAFARRREQDKHYNRKNAEKNKESGDE
jgi:hypothetical protein